MKKIKKLINNEYRLRKILSPKFMIFALALIVISGGTALMAWNTDVPGVDYTTDKVWIGVLPADMITWRDNYRALQIGGNATLAGTKVVGKHTLILGQNYYIGESGYTKITAGNPASMYMQSGGTHEFYIIPASGTDADRINALFIQNDGNVVVAKNLTAQSYSCSSDKRFKKNINPLAGALQKIKALNGVSYNWRVDEFPERAFGDKKDIGFIAQNVEEVLAELVLTAEDGYKSVSYQKVTAVLVEAVKEIDANYSSKISALEKENASLKQKVASLEKMNQRIAALEKVPGKQSIVSKK